MVEGREGDNCHVILRPGTNRENVTGMVYENMAPGEVLVNCSGGGGGWGDPLQREPAKVLEDVRNEYISLTSARAAYGVVIDPETLTIDTAATTALRCERLAPSQTTPLAAVQEPEENQITGSGLDVASK